MSDQADPLHLRGAVTIDPRDVPPPIPEHPLAGLFPLMDPDEFSSLVIDIHNHGQREEVVLYEGHALDGRNRSRACGHLGITPRTREYDPGRDGPNPRAFVVSVNLHRRHLTTTQRAMIAANLANWQVGENQHTEGAPIDAPSAKVSGAEAADLLGVSERSVERAKRVGRDAVPELAAMAGAGGVAIGAAAEVAKLPPAEQREVVAAGPDAVRARAADLRGKKEQAEIPFREKRKPAHNGPTDGAGNGTRRRGVGVKLAQEAINCLRRIPDGDPLRKIAFQTVRNFLEENE